jgi:cullin 3
MFLDMKLSKEIFDLFKCTDLCKSNPLDIEVQTLTASHWALKVPTPCVLPTIINECMNQFNAFYIDKFNASRRLSWLTNMGSADMKATFATGKKELKVSTYQMCILLLFNHSNTISLDTIRQSLQVPEVELRRHLLSLCTPKLKILIKESKGKLIEDNDNFTFNNDFISNNKKIKIPLISAKEIRGEEETTQMEQKIEEDRRHQVEAAIVRVMKARKRVAHNDLVAEVSRQLLFRFSPNLQFIKKRIESLIEREYIAREDEKNYKYLA